MTLSAPQFLENRTSPLILVDPWLGKDRPGHSNYGCLRTLPLLVELGFTRFAYPQPWESPNADAIASHERVHVNFSTSIYDIPVDGPIVLITSHRSEEASQHEVAKKLLAWHRLTGQALVYVVDRLDWQAAGFSSERPFIEIMGPYEVNTYDALLSTHLDAHAPVLRAWQHLTQNLFMLRQIEVASDPTAITQLRDVFRELNTTQRSYFWNLVLDLCEYAEEDFRDDVIKKYMRLWFDQEGAFEGVSDDLSNFMSDVRWDRTKILKRCHTRPE